MSRTYRLAVIQGETLTPLSRRTYPITIVVDKAIPAADLRDAVRMRAGLIGEDVGDLIAAELLDALRREGVDVTSGRASPPEPEPRGT